MMTMVWDPDPTGLLLLMVWLGRAWLPLDEDPRSRRPAEEMDRVPTLPPPPPVRFWLEMGGPDCLSPPGLKSIRLFPASGLEEEDEDGPAAVDGSTASSVAAEVEAADLTTGRDLSNSPPGAGARYRRELDEVGGGPWEEWEWRERPPPLD